MSREGARDGSRLGRRLAAISAAPPVRFEAPPAPREKRVAERRVVYRFARLLLPNRTVLACIVRDLSTTGARIVIEGAVTLPRKVIMKIDQTGETRRALVVWQEENVAGLAFDVSV